MTQEEKQKMMTEASIPGLIGRMAAPTIISMLVTSFYNMTDTFFVGKIESNSATAAVGVVFPLMAVIQAVGFFFGHGSGNAISRRLGCKNTEVAEQLSSCGFYLALFSGFLIFIFGTLFLEPLAYLLGSTDTILPYSKSYLGIILIGAPFMTASLVLNNQMRFQGNAFYAMIGITTGAVLNVVLDPVLIFIFDMGVAGAAAATIISQFISFILLLIGIKKANCVPIKIKNIVYLPKQIGEIFRGGLPSLCRQGLSSLATVFLNHAAGPYGDAAIAAMTIVTKIMGFANSAIIGFGQGFQPVCGFNYGAGRKDRLSEAFWFCVKVSTVVLLVLCVCGIFFSDELIALFRKDDIEVIEIGTRALRYQCLTLPLSGWIILNNMMFQTCRQTVPASVLASARQGLFFIPCVLILPLIVGLTGVEVCQSVADIMAFVLAVILNVKLMKKI